MLKLKKLKYLLLLMLFALAGQNAWADKGDTKYSYYVFYNKVKVNKTGAGLVYTQQGTKDFDTNYNKRKEEVHRGTCKTNDSNTAVCTELVDKQTAKTTFYMKAEEKEGYKFVHWIDESNNVVNEEKYCAVSVTTTNYCGEYTEAESKVDTIFVDPQANNSNYYDALYTAVFEPLVNEPLVTVKSNNNNYGSTTITHEDNTDAVENNIDDDIVLFAYTLSYDKKFLGWQKNGEIVSRENPWHMQVSEENAGEYTAVFDDGYKFCRMKNFGTEHRYVTAINDEGSLSDLTAIKLENTYDSIIANPGSVIKIYSDIEYVPTEDGQGTKRVSYYDFIVQNSSGVDKNYYDFSAGEYLRMPHYTKFMDEGTWAFSQADITYNENGKKVGLRFRDKNGEASFGSIINDPYSQWYIEPMDKDLETAENYFSLDPNKLVEVDGKYYTTLRTSWNILYNSEQMTPYVVTSVDETEGTFEMEPITGNIIPAGTPVIIETKSNVVLENRMVPATTAAASGAVPGGNLLQVSTKYFPNQAAPVANCKGLIKNADGQLAFGGNALSTVNGNEAYLSVANEVVLPKPIPTVTLAQLVANGEVGKTYEVTDLTGIDVVDHDQLLICKDDNGYANKDENTEDYIDYMQRTNGIDTYDQSNWIGLRVPEGKEFTQSVLKKRLKGVVGKLIDKVNPELQLTQVPEDTTGTPASTDLNLYIAASFYGVNHQTGKNDKEYFFVQPKPMELANVEMAQWSGDKFIVPVHDEAHPTWNTAELRGEFEFNGSYMSNVDMSYLQTGHNYNLLPAVVKYKTSETAADHVYVLGNVNGLNPGDWSPLKGVEMSTCDGNIYTATLTVNAVDNGYGYFSFTKKLGESWSDINAYRFGADTQNMGYASSYPVNDSDLGTELPMRDDWSDGSRPFKLSADTYKLTVNLTTMKLIITKPTVQAPRLEGASPRSYVVYPLSLERTTNVENGVITVVTDIAAKQVVGVTYYNVTGLSSERPFEGVNIVVTRYSDGSISTAKRLF